MAELDGQTARRKPGPRRTRPLTEAEHAQLERCHAILAELDEHKAAIKRLGAERSRLVAALWENGRGMGELAQLLGVSRGRIQQVRNGGVSRG